MFSYTEMSYNGLLCNLLKYEYLLGFRRQYQLRSWHVEVSEPWRLGQILHLPLRTCLLSSYAFLSHAAKNKNITNSFNNIDDYIYLSLLNNFFFCTKVSTLFIP